MLLLLFILLIMFIVCILLIVESTVTVVGQSNISDETKVNPLVLLLGTEPLLVLLVLDFFGATATETGCMGEIVEDNGGLTVDVCKQYTLLVN